MWGIKRTYNSFWKTCHAKQTEIDISVWFKPTGKMTEKRWSHLSPNSNYQKPRARVVGIHLGLICTTPYTDFYESSPHNKPHSCWTIVPPPTTVSSQVWNLDLTSHSPSGSGCHLLRLILLWFDNQTTLRKHRAHIIKAAAPLLLLSGFQALSVESLILAKMSSYIPFYQKLWRNAQAFLRINESSSFAAVPAPSAH